MKTFVFTEDFMGEAHEQLYKKDLDKIEAGGKDTGYSVGRRIELEPHDDGLPQFLALDVRVYITDEEKAAHEQEIKDGLVIPPGATDPESYAAVKKAMAELEEQTPQERVEAVSVAACGTQKEVE